MRCSPRRSRAHSLFRSEYPLCHKDASARPPRAIVWPSAQAPIAWRPFSDLIGGITGIPGPQKITFGEMADSGARRDTRGHSLMMSIGSDSGIASSRP